MSFSNHLVNQTSPYLLQHAHNPVDWFAWGEEALNKALAENKPILLSIGYSACHWCHVMAHESFEDEETARLMNSLFVNIKVDREERPDLDNIYQTAHQVLTGRPGGWPLTIILDPQHHVPFFTGTYFPKETHYQLPAFKEILRKVSDFYRNHREEISAQAPRTITALQQLSVSSPAKNEPLSLKPWQEATVQLAKEYDAINGGFGHGPKFPHPSYLELLLHNCQYNSESGMSRVILENSLTKMALGGIYDQIGGGFYRYAVDEKWQIPHFEKMLYDNAQLVSCYASAYALMPNPLFKQVVTATATWIIQEMQSPKGGYYSSLDTDSEGEEGKYYLWRPEQIKLLLTAEEYNCIAYYFNLAEKPNFRGHWHLCVTHALESMVEKTGKSISQLTDLIHSATTKLLLARRKRLSPGCDEKILTAWNALMIKGMVIAGMNFAQPTWLDSAQQALEFMQQSLWKNGRLLASYKDNRAHLSAYLDDYAFLLDAILTFLQCRWHTKYLVFAQQLSEVLLLHFQDKSQGGFFFVADGHERLIYRPKILSDNVIPAGSAIACYALQRLGYLLADSRYLQAAHQAVVSAWKTIQTYPSSHISWLLALQEFLTPPKIFIIRGSGNALKEWQAICQKQLSFPHLVFAIDDRITLPQILADKMPALGPIAYVCQGTECRPPVTTATELRKALKE